MDENEDPVLFHGAGDGGVVHRIVWSSLPQDRIGKIASRFSAVLQSRTGRWSGDVSALDLLLYRRSEEWRAERSVSAGFARLYLDDAMVQAVLQGAVHPEQVPGAGSHSGGRDLHRIREPVAFANTFYSR